MKLFEKTIKATFVSRPNRFVVVCEAGGKRVSVFLPNPGRLHELFFPGVTLWLTESTAEGRKYKHTAVAVERDGRPVVLHTHMTNDVAAALIDAGRVPSLKGARVVRKEVTVDRGGHRSRFDLLIEKDGEERLVEVKSCTLFSKSLAMFPDAVTERGRRHLAHLSSLSKEGVKTAVVFIVHAPKARAFLPDYHTDLAFARTMLEVKERVKIIPVAVDVGPDFEVGTKVKELPIPYEVVEREAHDSGSYMVVFHVKRRRVVRIGSLGRVTFDKGFYLYVGSVKMGLSKRIERHRRLRKNKHWHVDYLREVADFHASLPVLTSDDIECDLAADLKKLSKSAVPAFGSSDCNCPSHLFYFPDDPLQFPAFHDFLQYWRMERVLKEQLPLPEGRGPSINSGGVRWDF